MAKDEQGAALSGVAVDRLTGFQVTPHVCATCAQFMNDTEGMWGCKKDRAGGDVAEGTQWMCACRGWRSRKRNECRH